MTTAYIVLHHAAADGGAQDVHRWHLKKGWIGIAYHYYIRKDGSIYRARPEKVMGAHTQGYNNKSIAICFEGNFEAEYMNETQLNAGAALIIDIKKRFLGLSVMLHNAFDETACPGANFPLTEILAAVDAAEIQPGPDIWAKEAADWAVVKGLFAGDETGKLFWKDYLTRQELAVVLKRFAEM